MNKDAFEEMMADQRVYSQRLENTYSSTVIEPVTVIEPLKGQFTDYLTDLEGSKCEILEDWDINLMPFKWRNKSNGNNFADEHEELWHYKLPEGVDLDQFKADCEEIDNE